MIKYSLLSNTQHDDIDPDSLFLDLMKEVTDSYPGVKLSFSLAKRLERVDRSLLKGLVNRKKEGVTPLFLASKLGQVEIVEYLIECGANIETKCQYEVQEDRSTHVVTPLWCAAVSGNVKVIDVLLKAGADINAVSDSGSTPIRSACFMTHFDVVEYLVMHGADVNKSNYNGGTSLINSVQSRPLCEFLLQNGADVNATDIQNKSALHYAIQEHRLETTQLLLIYGADYQAVSRYGDDALQMACLKGAKHIFDFLILNIRYPPERLANAHELIGTTFFDEHSDRTLCFEHWRSAMLIRQEHGLYPKSPTTKPLKAFRYEKEFEDLTQLEECVADIDKMRIQSLLVAERILGPYHKDTIFRLMYRGASYADTMCYQRCIDLWSRALQIRIRKDSIIYTDTWFTALAILRVMIDFHTKSKQNNVNNLKQRFDDVLQIFYLLTYDIEDIQALLNIQPQYKRQIDYFEKIMQYVTHLIYLMIDTAQTKEDIKIVHDSVRSLVARQIRCNAAGDSILHLVVSSLNSIRSTNLREDETFDIFPNVKVAKFLLSCNANVNATNNHGLTPLHLAALSHNFKDDLVKLLLDHGAHLDQPDNSHYTPLKALTDLKQCQMPLVRYMTLKCLCASIIVKKSIPYENYVPKTLGKFVKKHEKPENVIHNFVIWSQDASSRSSDKE